MRTSKLSTTNKRTSVKRLKTLNTRSIVPLEDDEAKAFHQWLEIKHIPHTHIGNESNGGTQAARIRGAKMKRLGQSKGFWDYIVFVPYTGITGNVDAYDIVFIEMKRKKGGVVSKEQKAWGRVYQKAGIQHKICRGAEEAIKFISELMMGE